MSKVGAYVTMAKTGFVASVKVARELAFVDALVEGVVFHAVNTTLNEVTTTQNFDEKFIAKINPFGSYTEQQADGSIKEVSSAMGYAESVAFM